MEYYTTSLQHTLAELERVDLFIQMQVWRARQVQKFNDEFQGIHIPEQEVDALLTQHLSWRGATLGTLPWPPPSSPPMMVGSSACPTSSTPLAGSIRRWERC